MARSRRATMIGPLLIDLSPLRAPEAGGLQSGFPMRRGQADDARTGAKALFGMGTRCHDMLESRCALRADLSPPIEDPPGSPLQVPLVSLGPVFVQGGELAALEVAGMGGDPLALVKLLHRGIPLFASSGQSAVCVEYDQISRSYQTERLEWESLCEVFRCRDS